MPSPNISKELRISWVNFENDKIISTLTSQGIPKENILVLNSKNRHFKILGQKRTVELYATTGTVNSAPLGSLGASTAKGMYPERAIKRIVSLANIGH